MHQLTSAGPGRRHLRILLAAFLLVASSLSTALANQATPAADSDNRLYLGNAGGFVASIPDNWVPDRSLGWDYAGPDGFVVTSSIPAEFLVSEGLEGACEPIAEDDRFLDMAVVTITTWRDRPACEVRVENEHRENPVTLVFAHPDPGAFGDLVWVAVTVDAAHFDEVIDSVSFDTSGVTAAMYLDSVLDILETRSLWRDTFDWDDLRRKAHERLGSAADRTALGVAWTSIRYVIDAMQWAGADEHTIFVTASQVTGLLGESSSTDVPAGQRLDGGIGYIAVPTFGGTPEESLVYIENVRARIAEREATATCGWIVDLRMNRGGGVVPMVTGLAPLLPPGPFLTVRDVAGDATVWKMTTEGVVAIDGEVSEWLDDVAQPLDPALAAQPVAILIGRSTASAAEATGIAFIGRDSTAFFGQPTAGVATVSNSFPLLDGSLLRVATSWMGGPNGAIYPEGLAPDVEVSPGGLVDPLSDDTVVQAASEWLRQQPECDPAPTPAA